MKTGGQLIVEALETNGVDRLYCVPGESYLAVLDALHDSKIRTIVCRQEGGAAMMADCHGKLTGRPGICFVTRGPAALPYTPVETGPSAAQVTELGGLLANARRPIAILGGSRWTAAAKGHIEKAAEAWALPVGCSFRRQMLFDHMHPCYAGDVGIGPNPKLAVAIKEA